MAGSPDDAEISQYNLVKFLVVFRLFGKFQIFRQEGFVAWRSLVLLIEFGQWAVVSYPLGQELNVALPVLCRQPR